MEQERKFNTLQRRLEQDLNRSLRPDEERYIWWLCSWDMETYEVFKRLFCDLAKS